MDSAPRTALAHPLVLAYLDDLDRALATADSQERLDTLTAVNEHLVDALGSEAATDAQVRAVLDDLGPVERIAAASTPVQPRAEVPAAVWLAPALLVASLLALALVPLMVWLAAVIALGCLVTSLIHLRRGSGSRSLVRAAAAISVVTLVVTAVLAVTLLAGGGTTTPSPPDVQRVASQL